MPTNYGLPYMGSKSRIAAKVINALPAAKPAKAAKGGKAGKAGKAIRVTEFGAVCSIL